MINVSSSACYYFRAWIKGAVVLVILLGLTWVFGFFFFHENLEVFAYIFTILNSLQGLFIFIFHCIGNEKVMYFKISVSEQVLRFTITPYVVLKGHKLPADIMPLQPDSDVHDSRSSDPTSMLLYLSSHFTQDHNSLWMMLKHWNNCLMKNA